MSASDDYYTILGVAPGADDAAIRAAYRAMMRRYHPDVNASADAIATATAINEAYGCLRDAGRRAAYDLERTGRARRMRSAQSAASASAYASASAPPRPVWTGPRASVEPTAPWYQPSWGKAIGLGVSAVITGITFAVTSAVPTVAPAAAREAVEIRMRAAQKGATIPDCPNGKASVGPARTTGCRS